MTTDAQAFIDSVTADLNICQAGHQTHSPKYVKSEYGELWIWDWAKYQNFPGYCTGQDEVSKSIEINGYWERPDTEHMLDILNEPGLMLDFGSHIGWFSRLAQKEGCEVWTCDADPENSRLLRVNLQGPGVHLGHSLSWAKDAVLPAEVDWGVRFLKADVEGHEHEVLALTRDLWKQRLIDYALLELSPIFENRENINSPSYALLVDEIISYGYRVYILKGKDRWYIEGKNCEEFEQENGWVEKA